MSSPTNAPSSEDTVWVTRCPVPTGTGIALDQGWLQAEFGPDGVPVSILQESNDRQIRLQHVYHDLRGLFREGGNIPALWSRANGLHNTAIVGLTWVDERQVLLARPGSGLSGPESLKGKRLGLSNSPSREADIWRGMALRGYTSALKVTGLSVEDVELVDLETPPQEWGGGDAAPRRGGGTWSRVSEDALLRGDVDVIYVKGAPADVLRQKHDLDVVFDINAHPDPKVRINNGTPRPITIDLDFLAARPDLVARYLGVLLYTADWARSHAKDVRRVVAQETSTDETSVLAAYGPDLQNNFTISLAADRIDAFEDQKNFLRDWKLIPSDIDVRSWIHPEPLIEAQRLLDSGAILTSLSKAA